MTTTMPTVGYFRYPPIDPADGGICGDPDKWILLGALKHNEAPVHWKREDCDSLLHDHWFVDLGDGLHVTLCPDGVGTPQKDFRSILAARRREDDVV